MLKKNIRPGVLYERYRRAILLGLIVVLLAGLTFVGRSGPGKPSSTKTLKLPA